MEEKDFCKITYQINLEHFTLIDASKPNAKCTGCFKCWLKNPGACHFSDKMQYIGKKLLMSDEIIIVCKSLYGGFSVNIKHIIDRVIPGVLPFFIKVNNELHHAQRHKNNPDIKVIFYNGNEMSEKEREHSKDLLAATAINFHLKKHMVIFADNLEDGLREVAR